MTAPFQAVVWKCDDCPLMSETFELELMCHHPQAPDDFIVRPPAVPGDCPLRKGPMVISLGRQGS